MILVSKLFNRIGLHDLIEEAVTILYVMLPLLEPNTAT